MLESVQGFAAILLVDRSVAHAGRRARQQRQWEESTTESLEVAPASRRRRTALVAVIAFLIAGAVTWNVVFDRAIEAAQQRYLALEREHPGAVTIRQVMDPAIDDAAIAASGWAAMVGAAGAIVALAAGRRRGLRRPAPAG